MDTVIDEVVRIARRCERAARVFERPPLSDLINRLNGASESLGKAWSNSWMGYFARIYKADLMPRQPGEILDAEWHGVEPMMDRTRGPWKEFTQEQIKGEILRRAGQPDLEPITAAADAAARVFEDGKTELITTLDAALSDHDDRVLRDLRSELGTLRSHTALELIEARRPGTIMTRNTLASQQGVRTPPHVQFEAWLFEQCSNADAVSELAKLSRQAAMYMRKKLKMKGRTVARTEGRIYIGHGGTSLVWLQLKDFLTGTLGLDVEEYNVVATAGKSRKERLQEMLDASVFAFLVMTAEDEHADGTRHARENVIHEVGLFQGRLTFERAIVMLEAGCTEFSNIEGIDQVRFPKGNMEPVWEKVRGVLAREKII